MTKQMIVTALAALLYDSQAECEGLRGEIAKLQAQDIPVIVYTDRDRAEVEPIREQLGLTGPFITESGSAIFTPVSHNPFEPALGEKDGDYFVEMLGCPYVQSRAGLRVIANVISHPLKGFGDFTVEQLKRSAKISEEEAHRAKAREFSEPFMTPKAVDVETLRQAAEEMGFGLIWRSPEVGRFSELIGAGAGIVPAVQTLVSAYQTQLRAEEVLKIVGISAHSDDLRTLDKVYPKDNQSVSWACLLMSPGEAKPINQLSSDHPGSWLSVATPLFSCENHLA
ncbi:MAG: haloacid dehalogenase [Phormidesmis sp.]